MDILKYEQLPHGGFAGLEERQFVTDRRLFRNADTPAFNGIGNFVYLADANFLPHGETRMHSHREIDVISVMVEGRIKHEGSLENGQNLTPGVVQVQRAGGYGFKHNEINPDDTQNQMIQIWVMPDEAGAPAGYRVYEPAEGELTTIYGGSEDQKATFDSHTCVAVANAKAGQSYSREGAVMAYISKGRGKMNSEPVEGRTLIRSDTGLTFDCEQDSQLIFIYVS